MKITNQAEYDAAKKTLEIPHVDFIMNAQGLRDQMLEYRRANKIFEAGDLVVSNCSNQENRVFVYKITIGKNIVVNCKRGKGYCYPKKWFRHADDKEIKAGRRLDLPESVVKSLGEVS